jgi:membrane protease YdiL (CAAX protease family)
MGRVAAHLCRLIHEPLLVVPIEVDIPDSSVIHLRLFGWLRYQRRAGQGGSRNLRGRLSTARWRYLFVLLGIPAIMVFGTIVVPGALASVRALDPLSELSSYLPLFVLVLLLGGPWFEEPGWRGFALPRLQQLHGPLVGTLILGVLWALWHLPEFFSPSWDTPKGSVLDVVWFVIIATALAIVYTWVFNNTRASLLLVILAHASTDAFSAAILYKVFPAKVVSGSLVNFVIGFGVVALLLVALTRGRLGYRGETNAPSAPRVR